jgi:hypothetical protein
LAIDPGSVVLYEADMRKLLICTITAFILSLASAWAQTPAPPHEQHDEADADAFEDARPDVALVGRLLMMKGHLRIGRELYDAGDRDGASGHFQHPLVEHYGDVEPALRQRQLKLIKPELQRLADAAPEAVPAAFDPAVAAIDRTLRNALTAVKRSPPRLFDVALRIARQAAHEYGNGLEGDTVFAPVEYQDGRGFLLAERDFVATAAALKLKDGKAWRALRAELDRMLEACPTPVPPAKVSVTHEALLARVKAIEALGPRFR